MSCGWYVHRRCFQQLLIIYACKSPDQQHTSGFTFQHDFKELIQHGQPNYPLSRAELDRKNTKNICM